MLGKGEDCIFWGRPVCVTEASGGNPKISIKNLDLPRIVKMSLHYSSKFLYVWLRFITASTRLSGKGCAIYILVETSTVMSCFCL